jgi:hypothetical protein
MTWQRLLVGWVVVACIAGPLIGRMLRHRADWAWQQEWDGNDFWDVPDPTDDTVARCERSGW